MLQKLISNKQYRHLRKKPIINGSNADDYRNNADGGNFCTDSDMQHETIRCQWQNVANCFFQLL